VLRHRLLDCWVVYRVRTHYGCHQGPRTPLTSILIAAATILGFEFCLDHICHQTVRRSSVCETPTHNQHNFGCVLPVLACVLDCDCRDKPLWRGHSCVMGDNQRSNGVVIARSRSFGALDHQCRDFHPIKLSYLMEDRASPLYYTPSTI
jgi:hypothetical protein